MKKFKTQKGITLIALIITIIILLILAVVTIGSIKDSNIITYAQNASTDYEKSKNDEEGIISGYEVLIEEKDEEIKGKRKDGVPIPEGFKFVEGSKNDGLVIENETEGSQFVWVPVPNINTMIMCKSKTASDQCNIKLNETKTALVCTKHNDSTDICGKLYGIKEVNHFNSERTDQEYINDSNKEPYDSSSEEKNAIYQAEFNEMAVSVAKNGGFYVGRYEVSFNEDKKAQSKGSTTDNPVYSAKNQRYDAEYWYGLYDLCKTYNTSSVKSSMIWGSQYDAMLIWMGTDATNFDKNKRSTDRRTGYVSTDKIRNIYDLAGNSHEWTQEANGNGYRMYRSGKHDLAVSISYRSHYYPTHTYGDIGSRLALYII